MNSIHFDSRMWGVTCLLSFTCLVAPAGAIEKANLSPAQLREIATHVVIGDVVSISTRQAREGGYGYTYYLAEVRVETCEKGEDIESGELVYVRYWTRRWLAASPPPPSTSGHRGLPDEGDRIRIYLARNAYDGFGTTDDGGLNVIGANGFEATE